MTHHTRTVIEPLDAFEWVERQLGGRIVGKQRHERWRPQWFLDVALADGESKRVVLRGMRNPGYASPNVEAARGMLRVEAEMLRTLQQMPVKAPQFLGANNELGWLLMECVEGDAELTELHDPDLRFSIFKEYIEDIAVLHSQPLDRARVPAGVFIPEDSDALVNKFLRDHLAYYRNQPSRPQPEPLLEFGIQWLQANPLHRARPLRLGLGDIGPNQFLFADGHYKALLDYEYAMVADPLMEIGLMRSREMTYPIGRMGELIAHYGAYYEQLTDEPLDIAALHYWTVFGVVVWPLLMNPAIQHPNPDLADQAFLYSWETHHRRCISESLAEQYGIDLHPPEYPAPEVSLLTPLHQLIVDQFNHHYAMGIEDGAERGYVRYSAAIAETLARGNAYGAKMAADNQEELGELLGARPDTVTAGLWSLEALVAADHQKDFEKRVRFFHRFELRKEFLYEPMQVATGCASRSPLGHLSAPPPKHSENSL